MDDINYEIGTFGLLSHLDILASACFFSLIGSLICESDWCGCADNEKLCGLFNQGNPEEHTILEFAQLIKSLVGKQFCCRPVPLS